MKIIVNDHGARAEDRPFSHFNGCPGAKYRPTQTDSAPQDQLRAGDQGAQHGRLKTSQRVTPQSTGDRHAVPQNQTRIRRYTDQRTPEESAPSFKSHPFKPRLETPEERWPLAHSP